MNQEVQIRCIEEKDNFALAKIIRDTLIEFKVNKPGTVFFDASTDNLYALFSQEKAVYYVVTENGEVLGGCGIFPTVGLPENCAELVKLYITSKARGRGIGKKLLLKCFEEAVQMGFTSLYLESLPELFQAVSIYEKIGFKHLKQSLGASGHFSCNIWMIKDLSV